MKKQKKLIALWIVVLVISLCGWIVAYTFAKKQHRLILIETPKAGEHYVAAPNIG